MDIARQVTKWRPGREPGIGALGDRLVEIDQRIAHAGCVHPLLKLLADLYAKRKENHQGEDIEALARANEEECRRLKARRTRFGLIGKLLQVETGFSSATGVSAASMST